MGTCKAALHCCKIMGGMTGTRQQSAIRDVLTAASLSILHAALADLPVWRIHLPRE